MLAIHFLQLYIVLFKSYPKVCHIVICNFNKVWIWIASITQLCVRASQLTSKPTQLLSISTHAALLRIVIIYISFQRVTISLFHRLFLQKSNKETEVLKNRYFLMRKLKFLIIKSKILNLQFSDGNNLWWRQIHYSFNSKQEKGIPEANFIECFIISSV